MINVKCIVRPKLKAAIIDISYDNVFNVKEVTGIDEPIWKVSSSAASLTVTALYIEL